VLASLLPDRRARWSGRELLFLIWVRETGVVPAALAGLLASRGLGGAELLSAVVLVAILVTVVVQGSLTGRVARALGVAD
jgi:cell volume regulation protein A